MLKIKVRKALENAPAVKPKVIITALSGGADSVALLHSLYSLRGEMGFRLCACHINHNLRGEESDRDEMFVRRLCRYLDIPLYVKNIVVENFRQKHESTEQCARNIRYAFFEELVGIYGDGTYIATAHTASDNCETVLINMLRGTALSGICGIPLLRDAMIRPVLYCTREDIEEYCTLNGLSYVTDSTNLTDDYTRNKLRHNVIPVLKEINPALCEAISRMTASLSQDDRYLDSIALKAKTDCRTTGGYNVKLLAELDDCILSRVVSMILKESGVPVTARTVSSSLEIIRNGKGKFNPVQYKFVMIRKKTFFVQTDYEKFRRK